MASPRRVLKPSRRTGLAPAGARGHDEAVRPRPLVALALALVSLAAPALAQDAASLRALITARYPSVRWVRAATLEAWMREERALVLLDARQLDEHRVSHLAGARRVDPDRPDVASLAIPEGARVVVYCSVGWRSASVADALARAGRSHVFNLEGGIFAWANEGRRVVRGGHAVRAVHPYDATWGRLLRRELHAYTP